MIAGAGRGEPEFERPGSAARGSAENGICGIQQENGGRSTAAQGTRSETERLVAASREYGEPSCHITHTHPHGSPDRSFISR